MLPHYRRIQSGRTHREMWRPESYAGIERAAPPTLLDRIWSVLLATAIGGGLAVLLAYGPSLMTRA